MSDLPQNPINLLARQNKHSQILDGNFNFMITCKKDKKTKLSRKSPAAESGKIPRPITFRRDAKRNIHAALSESQYNEYITYSQYHTENRYIFGGCYILRPFTKGN